MSIGSTEVSWRKLSDALYAETEAIVEELQRTGHSHHPCAAYLKFQFDLVGKKIPLIQLPEPFNGVPTSHTDWLLIGERPGFRIADNVPRLGCGTGEYYAQYVQRYDHRFSATDNCKEHRVGCLCSSDRRILFDHFCVLEEDYVRHLDTLLGKGALSFDANPFRSPKNFVGETWASQDTAEQTQLLDWIENRVRTVVGVVKPKGIVILGEQVPQKLLYQRLTENTTAIPTLRPLFVDSLGAYVQMAFHPAANRSQKALAARHRRMAAEAMLQAVNKA